MLNQSKIDAATAGFRTVYLNAYEGATPKWLPISFEVESNSHTETYQFLTGVSGMKEMVGEVKFENASIAEFSLKNVEWENSVKVKMADIERDRIGLYRPMFSEMAQVARFHPELLIAEALSAGFDKTDYTGLAFFANNKPYDPSDKSKDALKFSNKGTAALSSASFVAARTNLKKRTDGKGQSLNLGQKLILVVPPALEHAALSMLQSENISVAGGSTQTNVLRNTFEVMVLNSLSSDTAWFLMEGGRALKPMLVQFEHRPEFIAADDPKSSHAMSNKEFWYQAYGRWNASYALPQFAYGSTGAA